MVCDRLLRPDEPHGLCRIPVAASLFGTPAAISDLRKNFGDKLVAGSGHEIRDALVVGISHAYRDECASEDPINLFTRVLRESASDLALIGTAISTKTHTYLLALPEKTVDDLTVFDWNFTY